MAEPLVSVPALAASFVSPGVKVDGGGFIIIGGRVIPVPPWDPEGLLSVLLRDIYVGLATVHLATAITDPGLKHSLSQAALDVVNKQVGQLPSAIRGGK